MYCDWKKTFICFGLIMKKLLSLASLILAWGVFSVSYALDIDALFSNGGPLVDDAYSQILNNEAVRWYVDTSISACSGDSNQITITSPVVSDELLYEVPEYYVFLSPYRIEQIKSNDPSIDLSNIIMKRFRMEWIPSEMNFNIWTEDWLNLDTAYYGFVLPIDGYDEVWTPSKEICFQLSSNMCMLDQECETFDLIVNPVQAEPENNPEEIWETENVAEETHGAADCIWMKLANIEYSINGNTVVFSWTAVDGDDVDIIIYNPEEKYREKLTTVKMSDEGYTYTLRWNGVQEFKFSNGCGDPHPVKVDAAITEEKAPDIVTPATGPAENILYIAIAAIILYGVYTIFFRKSDNN